MSKVRFLVGFETDLLEWLDEVCGRSGRGSFLARLAREERARRAGVVIEPVVDVAKPAVRVSEIDRLAALEKARRLSDGDPAVEKLPHQDRIMELVRQHKWTMAGLAKQIDVDEVETRRLCVIMAKMGMLMFDGKFVAVVE